MDMKTVIAILLVAFTVSGRAANPDVKAFNTNHFNASVQSISLKPGGIGVSLLSDEVLSLIEAGTSGTNGVNGTNGLNGVNGTNGLSASVSVTNTITGVAGSQASVTNLGTPNNVVLEFTIPRGDTGATGPTGATGATGPQGPAGTNAVTSDGGWRLPVTLTAANTTNYWFDFGKTNTAGFRAIYQDLNASAGVNFIGITNILTGDMISISVVASGDVPISWPSASSPHVNTNGLTLSGGRYSMVLSNGHQFIATLRTNNSSMTFIWVTPDQ